MSDLDFIQNYKRIKNIFWSGFVPDVVKEHIERSEEIVRQQYSLEAIKEREKVEFDKIQTFINSQPPVPLEYMGYVPEIHTSFPNRSLWFVEKSTAYELAAVKMTYVTSCKKLDAGERDNAKDIAREIGDMFDLSLRDMRGTNRKNRQVNIAKRMAMWRMRRELGLSLRKSGRFFDMNDHTAAAYGVSCAEMLIGRMLDDERLKLC